MREQMRSDLARECGCEAEREGVQIIHARQGEWEILRVRIKSEQAARQIGKPCGRYVTVECGALARQDVREREELQRILSVEIREMAERMSGKRVGRDFSVLVVGLGNRDMTPDALGPQTVRNIAVTRHGSRAHAVLGAAVCELAAFAPGVTGQTGLETVELVRGAVAAMQPDLVLAVDALAARETARLGSTVQLADTGIQPGSGVGGARPALDRESVGAPVMALGLPTVVETSTLVGDALARFGITRDMPEFAELLHNGKSFFVTPKEIDLLLPLAAELLSGAVEKAFSLM